MLPLLITSLFAYLIGCLPFAVIVSRIMGLQDPRSFGSKNPGATNVLRTGNKKAAIFTLLGDLLKGTVAVLLAQQAVVLWGWPEASRYAAAIAVFMGHLFPISLGFKGGKGVATALGVILALQPLLALATLLTWLVVFFSSRYSSLAALVAAVLTPAYYFAGGSLVWPLSGEMALSLIALSALLIWRHAPNIKRLLRGEESKFGRSKASK